VEFDVHAVPFGDEHWRQAAVAFARYRKGRHPAALDFGDCLTYAVAKLSEMPLLCAGGAFAQTDLELVPVNG
jgi:ribonuclease VapC